MAWFEAPASYAQRRMWLLDRLDPGRPTYTIAWAVRLDGPLDRVALDRAWAAAVARHEALRTAFRDDGGTPVQVVDDAGPVLTVEETPERGAAARLLDHARTVFDLGGPLVRARLLRLAPDRHVLSVVAHHAVVDGWSFRLVYDQIVADYAAVRDGRPPVSVEPELQYVDVAHWQLEYAAAGGYAPAEEYWRAELAGAPPELALPVDHAYPARPGYAAADVEVPMGAELAAALRRLAGRHGTTLFTVVLTGWAALLSRACGAGDVVVGVPVAARTRTEIQPVVGLFVNTLAIRARLHGDPTLGELLDRVSGAVARAQAHQDLPFARVVELLRPERNPTRAPLVQVFGAMEDAWPYRDSGGLRWQPELVANGTAKFELELSCVDGPGAELSGRLRYRTDLFAPETVERFAFGLGRMLAVLAAEPGRRVSDVDILSPATRELVTVVWPGSAAAPDGDTASALAAHACTGGEILVRDAHTTLTRDDVRARADRIAAGLRAAGVRVGDIVALLLPRSSWVLPAVLGTWWAGAAYLPLDPGNPPARLRALLAGAGVRVVLTDGADRGLDGSTTALDVTRLPAATGVPPYAPHPEDAAYVLYTSGSTGEPKAVVVTQGSLAQLLHAMRARVPVDSRDRLVAVTTIAFDIAVLEQLLPVLSGGSLVIADDDHVVDGKALRRLLDDHAVTVVQATPTTWRMLVDAGGVPAGVRIRLSGGEPLPPDLADALRDGAGVRLWNLYGPTETTVYSTGGEVTPGGVDVGTALPGTRVYVLDRWRQPVPPGVVGEVHIGGAGVGRGYLYAPGLTADRFGPDPTVPGARLYRTGDLGRWLATGRLDLLGRVDRQIKIRGYRVEAAEVEAVLRSHAAVGDAVVTADGDRLVGYVVGFGGGGPGTGLPDDVGDVLREHAGRWLPDHLVPAAIVALPELPRTAGGKVDIRALPAPRWGSPAGSRVAPRTPLERELTELVAGLLGRSEPVGVLDNFFVLGGHSVTAAQLMARVWTTYGVDLPVRTLFDNPTMAGLAAAITAAFTAAGAAPDAGPAGPGALGALTDDDVDALLATMPRDEGG